MARVPQRCAKHGEGKAPLKIWEAEGLNQYLEEACGSSQEKGKYRSDTCSVTYR